MTTQLATKRTGRLAALLLIVASMLLALTMFVAPNASAHDGKFDHEDARFADTGCDAGTAPTGDTTMISGRLVLACTPDGDYVPIGDDQELCDEANGRMTEGVCTFDRVIPCGDRPDFDTPVRTGCVRAALVQAEFAHDDHIQARSVTPVCVETAFVQENAAGESVGAQFGLDGRDYLIVSGGSSCTFNCLDGWDMNCDGKLGDFCASEYDLREVAGVGQCLAAADTTISSSAGAPVS